jgi:hypothetical protein
MMLYSFFFISVALLLGQADHLGANSPQATGKLFISGMLGRLHQSTVTLKY